MRAFIKKVSNFFLIGVLSVLPIVVVAQVILFLNHSIRVLFADIYGYTESYLMTFVWTALTVALLSFIGYSIARYGKSVFISAFEVVIDRIPLLNTIYRVVKKLLELFKTESPGGAREVVYIEYPNDGLWVPGYVTNKAKDMYVVYIPTSPNPTSGFTVLVHESKLVRSAMSIEEVTSFVVSVGVDFKNPAEAALLFPKGR